MQLWSLVWISLLVWFQVASALKFRVEASDRPKPRCVRDFVTRDTLVVVNVKTSGNVGDGQSLTVSVVDNKNNEYGRKKDVTKDFRLAFTAHDDAAFDVCFENKLTQRIHGAALSRNIELDVEIGANARDWNAVQASERLKPVEIDLRKADEQAEELIRELEYLQAREERLRDTNESTNQRVKVFSVMIIMALLGLGVWQISYLRSYFRSKHII